VQAAGAASGREGRYGQRLLRDECGCRIENAFAVYACDQPVGFRFGGCAAAAKMVADAVFKKALRLIWIGGCMARLKRVPLSRWTIGPFLFGFSWGKVI
jgi:hypothetical protein